MLQIGTLDPQDTAEMTLQRHKNCGLVGNYWCQEKFAATNFTVDSNPENGICLKDYTASQTKDQSLNSHHMKSSKLKQK